MGIFNRKGKEPNIERLMVHEQFSPRSIFVLDEHTIEAISDETLSFILDRDDKQDSEAVEAKPYEVKNGTAIINVEGMLVPEENYLTRYSNEFTSVKTLEQQVNFADNDVDVDSIAIKFKTPGGNVIGVSSAGNAIFNTKKPTVGQIQSICTSGGIWLASQCDYLISEPDAMTASIGAYTIRDDTSEMFAKAGVTRHIIKDGDYKATGEDGVKITKKDKDEIKRLVSFHAESFVNALARGRNVDYEVAVAWKDGRTQPAPQALELGLIDELGTFEDALTKVKSMVKTDSNNQTQAVAVVSDVTVNTQELDMNEEKVNALTEGFKNLVASILGTKEEVQAVAEPTIVKEVVTVKEELSDEDKKSVQEASELKETLATAYQTEYNRVNGEGSISIEEATTRVSSLGIATAMKDIKAFATRADADLGSQRTTSNDTSNTLTDEEKEIRERSIAAATKAGMRQIYGF